MTLAEVVGGFLLGLAVLGGIASLGILLLASLFVDTTDPVTRWPLVLGAIAITALVLFRSYGFATRIFLTRRGYKVKLGGPPPQTLVDEIRAAEAEQSRPRNEP
ncbi:MAG: hypothetical protein F4Y67_02990 [Chloroflexi bacterium]|nr:hypothetical protein [Chloroflexota bacterium]MDE2702526.1 hypothetical protein [Chloroflexota bacterium]MDE2862303.1 hypothetical protein [Chloroflexota bacterium]MDE2937254.1 hypothetical protein [Chloroflexota bacterium]MXW27919.1 hypothetical protein [Chloroflexota bacterium]